MIATTTTTGVEGGRDGTMTTGTIVVDVGVGPEITGTTIRGKVRPARIEIQGNTEEGGLHPHMTTRTGRRPPNSPMSNPWKIIKDRRAKRRRTRTPRDIGARGRRTDGRDPKTARGDEDRRLARDRDQRAARTSSMRKRGRRRTGSARKRPTARKRPRPSSSKIDLALPCPRPVLRPNGGRRRRLGSSSRLPILTLLYGPTEATRRSARSRRSRRSWIRATMIARTMMINQEHHPYMLFAGPRPG